MVIPPDYTGSFLPIPGPIHKKYPMCQGTGEYRSKTPQEVKPAGTYPTEYRCFIKEVNPLWRSGCGYLIADKSPSSVTQLPILTALHARKPTLLGLSYTKWIKM